MDWTLASLILLGLAVIIQALSIQRLVQTQRRMFSFLQIQQQVNKNYNERLSLLEKFDV